ncbi:hypothetical protein ANN_12653, partial [Periplaneta americana]
MVGLCEGGNEPPGSLKASNTESYPAFARIGLRENPGKNLNQVTCPDRDSNPGHLVSQPDALTVTPQIERKKIKINWKKMEIKWKKMEIKWKKMEIKWKKMEIKWKKMR